jgi:hypothetical protein
MWMRQGSCWRSSRADRLFGVGTLVNAVFGTGVLVTRVVVVAAFLVGGFLGLACGREKPPSGGTVAKDTTATGAANADPAVGKIVIARVGRTVITTGGLDMRARVQYPEMDGQTGAGAVLQKWEILRAAYDQLLWATAGERRGLDKDPAYRAQIELSRQFILSRYAQNKLVNEQAAPDEAAIRQYYDDNMDRFRRPARAIVQIVLVPTRGESEALRRRAAAGEDFDELARRNSRDETSARSGGNLGPIGLTSVLPGFSVRIPAINEAIFATPAGQTTPVIETSRGFCFFRVRERTEATTTPLDEVRPMAVKWLTSNRANQIHAAIREEVIRETKASIDTMAWFEYAFKVLTEEEVFQLAESEQQPQRGIAWFKAFVKSRPQSPRAAQALFIAGFSYAENLKDYARAGALFRQLLETYPQSDLVDSAKWMLENMDKGLENLPYADQVKRRAYGGS